MRIDNTSKMPTLSFNKYNKKWYIGKKIKGILYKSEPFSDIEKAKNMAALVHLLTKTLDETRKILPRPLWKGSLRMAKLENKAKFDVQLALKLADIQVIAWTNDLKFKEEIVR